MELNQKELECRAFMFNIFIPALHEMVEEINPTEYHKWGGNLCRQTAVFASHFLNKTFQEYDWQGWEGDFEDVVHGQPCRYEHAWVFGKSKTGSRRLFLDLAHNHKERLFVATKVNAYPKNSEAHKDMVCLSRKKLNVQEMYNDIEHHTGLCGEEFMSELSKRLARRANAWST